MRRERAVSLHRLPHKENTSTSSKTIVISLSFSARNVAVALLAFATGCGGGAYPQASTAYPQAEPESPESRANASDIRVVREDSGFRFAADTLLAAASAGSIQSNVSAFGKKAGKVTAQTYRMKARQYRGGAGRTVVAANAPAEKDTGTDAHDVALLVYTAGINLAVFQVVEKMNTVEQLARTAGGYLSKRADNAITIRVPREKFFETLTAIEKLGDVLHRDVQAVDVTDEYVDTEARLKNAHALRDRFESLLAHASVKDAVEISKELAKVTEIIEQLEGKMKLLKNKISFATIVVSFAARDNATVPDRSLLPFPWLQQMGLTPLLSVDP